MHSPCAPCATCCPWRFCLCRPPFACVVCFYVRPVLPVARGESVYAVPHLLALFVFIWRLLLAVVRVVLAYAVRRLLALFVFMRCPVLPVVRVVSAYAVRRLFVFLYAAALYQGGCV